MASSLKYAGRLLAAAFAAWLLCLALPAAASAAESEPVSVGDFVVSGGTLDDDFTYANSRLTIKRDCSLTVSTTQTTQSNIVVSAGVTVNLDLAGVSCQYYTSTAGDGYPAALTIESGATANLYLEPDTVNYFTGGRPAAGIRVPSGATLTIDGKGKLVARGQREGAGIGGSIGEASGHVIINDGIVEAYGGCYYQPYGLGGDVMPAGAGIGGGSKCSNGIVEIHGGTVKAHSDGVKASAAGIGGGSNGKKYGNGPGGSGGTIIITGGVVTGIGGEYGGAGIGGPKDGDAGTITITGGFVTGIAGKSMYYGAGIGPGGAGGAGGSILIDSATVVSSSNGSIGLGGNGVDVDLLGGSAVYLDGASMIMENVGDGAWNAMVCEGKIGNTVFYGGDSLMPTGDFRIPEGWTLTVHEGKSLMIDDVAMDCYGAVTVKGTLDYTNGVINNYSGAIAATGNGVIIPGEPVWNAQKPEADLAVGGGVDSAAYGSTIELVAHVAKPVSLPAASHDVAQDEVTFYANGRNLGTASAVDGEASLKVTLEGEAWMPKSSPVALAMSYSGGSGLLPLTFAESPRAQLQVVKAQQASPASVEVEKATDSSILIAADPSAAGTQTLFALEPADGQEPAWQEAGLFEGLSPETSYVFMVKYASDAFFEESDPAFVKAWTRKAAPAVGEGFSFDFAVETVSAVRGYEIRLADDGAWLNVDDAAVAVDPDAGQVVNVRKAATDQGASESEATENAVPARPDAPADVMAEPEGFIGDADGKIVGCTPDMEWRAADGGTWAPGTQDGMIENVAPGTYEVRFKATVSAFASSTVSVAVEQGVKHSYTLTFEVNGGSVIESVTVLDGDVVNLEAYAPEREGYAFKGWFADSELTVPVIEVEMTGDATVYASWEALPEDPDDGNGGTSTPGSGEDDDGSSAPGPDGNGGSSVPGGSSSGEGNGSGVQPGSGSSADDGALSAGSAADGGARDDAAGAGAGVSGFAATADSTTPMVILFASIAILCFAVVLRCKKN